jgi:5-methylcytosine-specific restriction endonuclease McrA
MFPKAVDDQNKFAKSKMRKLQMLGPRVQMLTGRRTKDLVANTYRPLSGKQRACRNLKVKIRDKFRCAACGRIAQDHEVDHRIPLSLGGADKDENLQLLCRGVDGCHAIKSAHEQQHQDPCDLPTLRKLIAAKRR